MFSTKNIIFGVIALLVLVGIPVSLFLLQNQQDPRSRASDEGIQGGIPTPTTAPGTGTSQQPPQQVDSGSQDVTTQQNSCQPPGQINNVLVDFPNCDETGNCSFTDANCTWNSDPNAQTYIVRIFQVENGETVLQGPRSAQDETKIVFPVEQNRTYQCEVQAQNSCGDVGVAGIHSLLCETGGVFPEEPTPTPVPEAPTPTVTPVPTSTPTPTIPAKPTDTPTPTIEEPGGIGTTVGIIGGLGVVVLIGVLLLAL